MSDNQPLPSGYEELVKVLPDVDRYIRSIAPTATIGIYCLQAADAITTLLSKLAEVERENCRHTGNMNPGPRIPLAYGSAATLICQACGRWRQDRPGFENGPWLTQSEMEDRLSEDEQP